ncbi:hypothetical protein [Mesorhizobium sp. M0213]|uniref:hypothetical protein n=1 Tax=Mesorhizobium sp. M0213 TaxID=2956917 RepID=UPI0033380847
MGWPGSVSTIIARSAAPSPFQSPVAAVMIFCVSIGSASAAAGSNRTKPNIVDRM